VSRLISSEILKLRTTRTFAAFVGAALGLALLVSILTAVFTENPSGDDATSAAYADVSPPFILMLAIVATAGEWRHRTIAGTILAAPDRVRLIAAKVAVYAGAGVLLSIVVNLGTIVAATVIFSARGEATPTLTDLLDVQWRGLVIAAFFGALGVGIGAIVRNQAGAIVGVLLTLFVVEPVLAAFVEDLAQFTPFVGAPSGLFAGTSEESEDALSLGLALLVMAGWVAATSALAAVMLRERDIA
jgi:hypothetical protein